MAPFMDRDKVTKPTAQIGFLKFVLIPMFETVTKVGQPRPGAEPGACSASSRALMGVELARETRMFAPHPAFCPLLACTG